MSSVLGSAFVDGVVNGGIPLGLALNRDRREAREQEQMMKLRDTQEKRLQEQHDLTMKTNTETFMDAQAKRQVGMLRGLYDAHNGDVQAMVRSPQGGVLMAQMMQNDPEFADRIATNPGYKAASFVPTADGKEFMLMLESKDGTHAPLTANRAAGAPAVKFSEQQLVGLMAKTAGRIGESDPIATQKLLAEMNVGNGDEFMSNLSQMAQTSITPTDIPERANLGAVASVASANNRDNFSANAKSAKVLVKSPLPSADTAAVAPTKSQTTPVSSSTLSADSVRGGETFQKSDDIGLRIQLAEAGLDYDMKPISPAQQKATLEALRAGKVPEAESPASDSSGAALSSAQKRAILNERLAAQKGNALGQPVWKQGTPLLTKEQRAERDAKGEAAWVAENKRAAAAREPVMNYAKQVVQNITNPLGVIVKAGKKAAGKVGDFLQEQGAQTRAAMEREQLRKAGVPESVTATQAHAENAKVGVVSAGAYSDDDIAGEGVADNRAGYKVQSVAAPQNKAERAAVTGAVPAKAVATPEGHEKVAMATETQIRSESLPMRVHNDGVALRTLQGATGGRITARQRYAAMRAHQTGIITDAMYANYMQSGRFSFEDVHAAVAVQNLRLSALRIQQDAAQSERSYLLEKERLDILRGSKDETLQYQREQRENENLKARRDEYKFNVGQVDNLIKTRAGVAYSSLVNAQGAPKYFGAVDVKGNVDTKLAEGVTQSMLSVVLQDPASRQLITGDNRRYDQLTANDVDRATEVYHAFINDPENLQRYDSGGGWMPWSDGKAGAINASAGSFVQWIAKDPRILRKQNRARTMEYTEQGDEE